MSLEHYSPHMPDDEAAREPHQVEELRARVIEYSSNLLAQLDSFQSLLNEAPKEDRDDLRDMALESAWGNVYAIEQALVDFDPASGLTMVDEGDEVEITDNTPEETTSYQENGDPFPMVQERKRYWDIQILEQEQRRFQLI